MSAAAGSETHGEWRLGDLNDIHDTGVRRSWNKNALGGTAIHFLRTVPSNGQGLWASMDICSFGRCLYSLSVKKKKKIPPWHFGSNFGVLIRAK